MLTLIQVQCPHCNAQGQLMVPPFGSIVMGPCPRCKELVVVFMGQALALDKTIMLEASGEEQREHVLAVLTDFLSQRLGDILTGDHSRSDEDIDFGPGETADESPGRPASRTSGAARPISQSEVELFTNTDLPLLDDASYFKSVFGPN